MAEDGGTRHPAWAIRHPVVWRLLEYLGLVTDNEPWPRRLRRWR
jgi:hypothetical protein